MKTSYFWRAGRHPKAVCIALSVPKFYKGKVYKPLMPTWDMVNGIKEGTLTEEEYTKKYIALLDAREVTYEKVVEALGEDAILICWEGTKKFCHRKLAARYLEQTKQGVSIQEAIISDVITQAKIS